MDRNEVVKILEEAKKNGNVPDLSGSELSGKDLSQLDLDKANFSKAKLAGTNFQGCTLTYANFNRANCHLADFTTADLSGADFSNADLRYSTLTETNFSSANLYKAKLSGCAHSNQLEIIAALGGKGTKKAVKKIEAKKRANVTLETDTAQVPPLPPIPILPLRWERLRIEAEKKNVALKPLIYPVSNALEEIKKEIRWIEQTRTGKLFVLSGLTGSGKTTFLNSMDLYIDDVHIYTISIKSIDSREFVEDKMSLLQREKDKYSVVVLEGKEAQGALTSEEIDILLTTLNADFRSEIGHKTLFVIPTTSPIVAKSIGDRATKIGGMVAGRDQPFYVFEGPSRREYFQITNETVRALNDSKSLAEFGVSDKIAKDLSEASETLGVFLENCLKEITRQRDLLASFATEIKRKRIHLWMVFCSVEEQGRINYDIVRSLTLDDTQQAQVNRVLVGESEEVRFWQNRKSVFAQASHYLDLRITYLPMRTANAVLTAYGHAELIEDLKRQRLIKRQATQKSAQDSLGSTAIGAFLQRKGFTDDPARRGRPQKEDKDIFREIVKLSSKDDKIVNSAIARALRDWNKDPDISIATEVSLNDKGTLVADIAWITPTDIYCLEFKWRSSVLNASEIIRETAGRVTEYAQELPELKGLLGLL